MPRALSAEVVFLGIATLYSLTCRCATRSPWSTPAVLVAIFVAYAWRLAEGPGRGAGPAGHLGLGRRAATAPRRATSTSRCSPSPRWSSWPAPSTSPRAWCRPASAAGRRPVHARAVGGAAGQRGARADRRVPVRVAAQGRDSLGHAAVEQGQPVDAAGGHDPDRVRALGRHDRRAAARHPAALRAAAHRRAVAVRGEHAGHPGARPRGARRCSCCSPCSSSAACCSPRRPTRCSSWCCPGSTSLLAVVAVRRGTAASSSAPPATGCSRRSTSCSGRRAGAPQSRMSRPAPRAHAAAQALACGRRSMSLHRWRITCASAC